MKSLSPKYLTQVPIEWRTNKPFIYKKDQRIIYALGEYMQDKGGSKIYVSAYEDSDRAKERKTHLAEFVRARDRDQPHITFFLEFPGMTPLKESHYQFSKRKKVREPNRGSHPRKLIGVKSSQINQKGEKGKSAFRQNQ